MRIGIIGGGQLALMMIQESPEHSYIVLEPNINSSVKDLAQVINKPYHDVEALKFLNDHCDVITYEFENVPTQNLKIVEDKLFPNSSILSISQNRLREKNLAQRLDIRTPKFWGIENQEELKAGLQALNGRGIFKTCEGGYDGKGQFVISNFNIPQEAYDLLNKNVPCILEEWIDFKYETSVVGCRDSYGNFECLPLCTNVHENNLLKYTHNFKYINGEPLIKATKKIMDQFQIIGTLAVEFFITKDAYYFNELAPRPHNSGHWSIEGCAISQFKNHINVICGKKVTKPQCTKFVVMVNLIGNSINKSKNFDSPLIYFHDYFKDEIKDMRKMGHVTILSNNAWVCQDTLNDFLEEIK